MLNKLTAEEQNLVQACLEAAASGELFDPTEVDQRLGVGWEELLKLTREFPRLDDSRYESAAFLAIDGSLLEAERALRAKQIGEVERLAHLEIAKIERVRLKWLGEK